MATSMGLPRLLQKSTITPTPRHRLGIRIETIDTRPIRNYIVPINPSFIEGHSAYESEANPIDEDRWYPSFNFQSIAYNNICISGPGTAKYQTTQTLKLNVNIALFKWGGHPPPMSTIEDPKQKPTYPLPNNTLQTNSLQNPTSYPEAILYSFDERRGLLTNKAAKRMQKDWGLKKLLLQMEQTHSQKYHNRYIKQHRRKPQRKKRKRQKTYSSSSNSSDSSNSDSSSE